VDGRRRRKSWHEFNLWQLLLQHFKSKHFAFGLRRPPDSCAIFIVFHSIWFQFFPTLYIFHYFSPLAVHFYAAFVAAVDIAVLFKHATYAKRGWVAAATPFFLLNRINFLLKINCCAFFKHIDCRCMCVRCVFVSIKIGRWLIIAFLFNLILLAHKFLSSNVELSLKNDYFCIRVRLCLIQL